jgi:hypothetical protein
VTGEFAFPSADSFFKKFQELQRNQKSRATLTNHLGLPNSSGSSQESKDHQLLEEFHSKFDHELQYLLAREPASKMLMLLVQVVVKLANQIVMKRVVVLAQMSRELCAMSLEVRQC